MDFDDIEDHSAKLFRAQTHIFNQTFVFINSMSLKCAIDLCIPDAIHKYGQPMSLSQLIASLSIHPSKTCFISRLMQILTHSGFFSQHNATENEQEVSYVLTDESKTLPTLFHTQNGVTFWDCASREPKLNHLFNDAMTNDSRLISSVVIEKCKGVFNGLESLVDVGGGTGTIAKAIAKSFPHLKCIVFDLPRVVDGLQGTEDIEYVQGDMFEAIPSFDSIMLKVNII
ncbi:hypothetical protein JHK82_033529 [Glycine max]|nr:hypothetical protein JHK85_034246 [Glycine max]KAG4985924.1 hypothetical protein JHK86_033615 [Glycine max]KAG5119109.1 hypothetical protein JHK82_033529 [Glycine max]KAG5140097.1 hypothetical protein JHK84_033865 [Glycine max]